MRTERELQLALAKLLDRVRVNNSWGFRSFREMSEHIINVSKAEATRFHNALIEMDLLRVNKGGKTIPNFDVKIWRNEDVKLALIREILEMFPDITQKKGRKKGFKYPKKAKVANEIVVVNEEEVNPLDLFTSDFLVAELRRRGYTVSATRQVIVQEEL